ncbi:MAG: acyl carrier protein [Gemmatimonadetes bacterium]|nr:acyl carrier protein [Gemmatimonadota bacterium]
MEDTQRIVKDFILAQFLPGEDPAALEPTTPLVTSAILDSLATMRLVSFLEERFGIQVEAHEASVDNLNTLDLITALVRSKR